MHGAARGDDNAWLIYIPVKQASTTASRLTIVNSNPSIRVQPWQGATVEHMQFSNGLRDQAGRWEFSLAGRLKALCIAWSRCEIEPSYLSSQFALFLFGRQGELAG